jgi:hypothetical protein
VERAIVPRQKLEDYLLDSAHEDGRHKARVFQSALGIAAADWRHLCAGVEQSAFECDNRSHENPRPDNPDR